MSSNGYTVIRLPSGGALHVAGPRAGTPVVLLHGVGGGAWSWAPQSDALTASRRTFVWEARGHGIATAVEDAGLADYYADVREAIAAVVASERRAPLIAGHSMGGLLAIAFATDFPEQTAGIFLVDPVYSTGNGYGHFGTLAAGKIALAACEPLLRSFERDGVSARALSRLMFGGAFENRLHMAVAWRKQRLQVPVEYPRMLRESFGRPAGFPLRDFARQFAVPVRLLEGSSGRDGPRFPELVTTAAAVLGDRFRYEWIEGGHYLQLDRPDAVTERLTTFARDLDAVTASAL